MKYYLSVAFLTCFCFVAFAMPVTAQQLNLGQDLVTKAGEKAGYDKATDEKTLAKNIGQIINAVLSLTGVIFTTLMVYAGYLWMTAGGADEQIDKAKNIIRASIIGLVITLGAYSISAFIVPRILARTVAFITTGNLFV